MCGMEGCLLSMLRDMILGGHGHGADEIPSPYLKWLWRCNMACVCACFLSKKGNQAQLSHTPVRPFRGRQSQDKKVLTSSRLVIGAPWWGIELCRMGECVGRVRSKDQTLFRFFAFARFPSQFSTSPERSSLVSAPLVPPPHSSICPPPTTFIHSYSLLLLVPAPSTPPH